MQKRLIIRAGAGLFAVLAAIGIARLSAQDPYPQVPPGGFAPNGQNPNGYYPGSGYQHPIIPYQPTAPMRPNDFPGGPVPPIAPAGGGNGMPYPPGQPIAPGGVVPANYAGPPYLPATQSAPAQVCQGTLILARVGNDVVLTSDLPAVIEDMIDNLKRSSKRKIPPEKIAQQRAAMMKELSEAVEELAAHSSDPDPVKALLPARRDFLNGLVRKQVEVKLLYQDFDKNVPKEKKPDIEEQVARRFEEFQLKSLMERENVSNRADLETALRAKGSSLGREKRIFAEQFISQTWLQQAVLDKKEEEGAGEVTHEEMLKWYQEHIKKFEQEPRVRWEEVMISFARHPNHDEAYAAIAALGNRVLAGASLPDVARSGSEGATARQGGMWDWTHKGSLTYEVLDQAIFSRPVGKLSEIIEAGDGYHIIRVVDHQNLITKNFLDVQKEIKESIKNERLEKRYKEFVEKLRGSDTVTGKYPVWTVFDNSTQQPQNPNTEAEDRYSQK